MLSSRTRLVYISLLEMGENLPGLGQNWQWNNDASQEHSPAELAIIRPDANIETGETKCRKIAISEK